MSDARILRSGYRPSEPVAAPTMLPPDSAFARHVAEGLRAPQAYLSSRFIYDDRGSKLFQEIMALEEYYLTRCEFALLSDHAREIATAFSPSGGRPLELIELGAGDGTKSKILLRELLRQDVPLVYRPVDISVDILAELSRDLARTMPSLRVEPIAASYAESLAALVPNPGVKRVLVFLGSNLGNFSLAQAGSFVESLSRPLATGDQIFIGIDLRKDPRRILAAYDDATGVTAAFNLNLLHRMRSELGAELDLEGWGFYPTYNPESGEVRSYLYPIGNQQIHIPSLDLHREFAPHELIHTEVSRKYTLTEIHGLADQAGTHVTQAWRDEEGCFADVLMQKS